DYMRISITDRCNLRCRYCMPDNIELVPMKDILSYEQIEFIARAAASVGIRKIKLTGGEPLIRRGCANLVGRLKQIPGIEQVTITTNGVLLKKFLPELVENGLDAVNISLDTLERDKFIAITKKDHLQDVLDGIDAAVEAGLRVKVNAVLQRGMNDDEWLDLLKLSMDRPLDVRFIEMMPIGFGQDFQPVYNDELLAKLGEIYPGIEKDESIHGNGPAVYYKLPGARGSVGFISAMHGKFCSDCNRIRLTSLGKLKPCLCFEDSVDLMPILKEAKLEARAKFGDKVEFKTDLEDRTKLESKATQENKVEFETDLEGKEKLEDRTKLESKATLENKVDLEEPAALEDVFNKVRDGILRCINMKPQNHKFEDFSEVTESKKMIEIGG
ncbi:MAG: GTP 3',8-cyclase MoaA, partial [Dorea sp.]|nr:GTP 3',8-cyclase MoaA [Dorea sp.]